MRFNYGRVTETRNSNHVVCVRRATSAPSAPSAPPVPGMVSRRHATPHPHSSVVRCRGCRATALPCVLSKISTTTQISNSQFIATLRLRVCLHQTWYKARAIQNTTRAIATPSPSPRVSLTSQPSQHKIHFSHVLHTHHLWQAGLGLGPSAGCAVPLHILPQLP